MSLEPKEKRLVQVGDWQVDARSNRLSSANRVVDLEPQVMDLLTLLGANAGEVVTKAEIVAAIWGDVIVNDDALTRCMFKLRKALGDDAREPSYIETVSKRGYRLIAAVDFSNPAVDNLPPSLTTNKRGLGSVIGASIIVIGGALLAADFITGESQTPVEVPPEHSQWVARADSYYSEFTRTDNEAAFQIYESILVNDPDNGAAMAGLANALTQRVIRYLGPGSEGDGRRSLTQALNSGWLNSDEAREKLEQAEALATRATQIDPTHDRAWRALGLVQSARQNNQAALRAYERTLVIDPEDWGTMINLSELYRLLGKPEQSTPYLKQAWLAMDRQYEKDPVGVQNWHSATGLAIVDAKIEDGNQQEANLWLQRVLARDPLNQEAQARLEQIKARFSIRTET